MAKSKAAKTPEKKPVVRSTLKAKIIKALTPQSEWEKKV